MKRFLVFGVILACTFMTGAKFKPTTQVSVSIPRQEDWIDNGKIFTEGDEGDWDRFLWGGFAGTVIKKDDVYYLYYQGSNGYDEAEGTVTYRAIGVATSEDGINFTKYPPNPVLTWFPSGNLEEGAVSAGASLSPTGEVLLYYGANSRSGPEQVSADGRLARSADGLNFTDAGKVLDHNDNSIWGSGDELFPIIGFSDNERWFVYYIPNGTSQSGRLGVAWGNRMDRLVNSEAVRSGGGNVSVWGQGGFARIGQDTYALFLSNTRASGGALIEARIVSLDRPNNLSAPAQIYRFNDVSVATVFLDADRKLWFMYYMSADFSWYGVKIAPAVVAGNSVFIPLIRR